MYQAFNLSNIDIDDFEYLGDKNYYIIGLDLFRDSKKDIQSNLNKYKDMDNSLSAKDMMDDWFEKIDADVFLSHSHKDKELVITLAGWLWEEFGIKSFIDSTVWGYANDLLRSIDNTYCQNGRGYDYQKRNYSTAHIHMMLSMSLLAMMDKCECLIFVNTPNSFIPSDGLDRGKTFSPWIFSEIAMSSTLRRNIPYRHRSSITESLESLLIKHEVDTRHLIPLSKRDLCEWKRQYGTNNTGTPLFLNKKHPLDILYKFFDRDTQK